MELVNRRVVSLAVVALALAVVAANARAAERPDAWITTKVKMALVTGEDVPGMDVNVDTVNGRVTLHGFVGSEAQKARASELARGVEGVSDVRNLLRVRPDAVREQLEVSDEEIRGRVEEVLRRDAALEGSDIEVVSVNDGVVLLGGRAETLSAHRRALEDARGVDGVRSVASQIESPDQLADAEIWREGEADGEGAGSLVRDLWITSRAKMRLVGEPQVSALDLNVDTRDGVVTLFGTVPSEAGRRIAEAQVKSMEGVRGVRNELQVVPETQSEAVSQSDEKVREAVRAALDERDDLGDARIDVEVADGVVRLTGEVKGQTDRLTAVTVAGDNPGVKSVVDELRVAPPGDVAAPRP